jgi:hypothetical protein
MKNRGQSPQHEGNDGKFQESLGHELLVYEEVLIQLESFGHELLVYEEFWRREKDLCRSDRGR